jgi:hypothetical protein
VDRLGPLVTRREVARRVLLWLGVVLFFVTSVWAALNGYGDSTGLAGFSAFPVVGAIILTSRPGNGVGRLLYAIGVFWTLSALAVNDNVLLAGPSWLEPLLTASGWPGWGAIPLIGVLFPTGRIETRAGRVLTGVVVGYVSLAALATLFESTRPLMISGRVNVFAWPAAQPVIDVVLGPLGILVFVGAVLGILIDLTMRWRRSSGTTRLQYRWLVWGLSLVVLVVAASGLLNLFFGGEPWVSAVTGSLVVTINLIPISIGVAVTRHGLYEIGRVISRTVSYAVVTLLVVGVYALVVVSLTGLLPSLPSVGVALATLVAAALFLPVLRFVQRWVDRRFDRERYDAVLVVDAFGEHLRTDVTPDSTAGELVQAVEQTLQPASVGLWTVGGNR